MDKIKDPDRNGKWHGPYDKYNEARKRAESLRSIVRDCKKCIKW